MVSDCFDFFYTAEGCNPNEQLPGEKGKTAMHAAAAAGHVGILKAFRRLVGNNRRTFND